MMPFGYLRDPLFVACFVLYWLNRLVIKRVPHPDFFHNHFNDLICIPFLVPILLYAAKTLRLRRYDGPPRAHEVILPLVIWSVLFEIVFPQHAYWSQWVTGDPNDVLYYAIGAFGASWYWQYRYDKQSELHARR